MGAPAKILWRTIRGMMPHKTARGAAAMDRLKVFEGIPHPFDKKKRQVIPHALKNIRMKPTRKFCKLGDLSKEVGWKHQDLIAKLDARRVVKSNAFHKKMTAKKQLKAKALKAAKSSISKGSQA